MSSPSGMSQECTAGENTKTERSNCFPIDGGCLYLVVVPRWPKALLHMLLPIHMTFAWNMMSLPLQRRMIGTPLSMILLCVLPWLIPQQLHCHEPCEWSPYTPYFGWSLSCLHYGQILHPTLQWPLLMILQYALLWLIPQHLQCGWALIQQYHSSVILTWNPDPGRYIVWSIWVHKFHFQVLSPLLLFHHNASIKNLWRQSFLPGLSFPLQTQLQAL